MGTPVPPPPIFGDDCTRCDDILWQTAETLRFVRVQFEGIIVCPLAQHDPPNGIIMLEQHGAVPCLWQYQDDDLYVHWWLFEFASHLKASEQVIGVPWWFDAEDVDLCETEFTNEIVACNGDVAGHSGTAEILLP